MFSFSTLTCIHVGFVRSLEMEKYEIQLSGFQGRDWYEILSLGIEKYGYLEILWRFFRVVLNVCIQYIFHAICEKFC